MGVLSPPLPPDPTHAQRQDEFRAMIETDLAQAEGFTPGQGAVAWGFLFVCSIAGCLAGWTGALGPLVFTGPFFAWHLCEWATRPTAAQVALVATKRLFERIESSEGPDDGIDQAAHEVELADFDRRLAGRGGRPRRRASSISAVRK